MIQRESLRPRKDDDVPAAAGPLRQAILDLGEADPRHGVAQLRDLAAFGPLQADRSLDDELLLVLLAAVQDRGRRLGAQGLVRRVEPARLHADESDTAEASQARRCQTSGLRRP